MIYHMTGYTRRDCPGVSKEKRRRNKADKEQTPYDWGK